MENDYIKINTVSSLPRIPLEGSIDLTYRCNNNCRHCWLRLPLNYKDDRGELTFDEIRGIVDEAKKSGCRKWSISGGEPMIRPDFTEIFEHITNNSVSYAINTNGTLITSTIANLLRKKGSKMVALYGATAKVHDNITRVAGSFDATMRGFAYLKEAKAGFTVQLIPMKDNYHEFKDMINLAKTLSEHYRVGAPWLYLSASGCEEINKEIVSQRLPAKDVLELDKPDSYDGELPEEEPGKHAFICDNSEYLFSSCVKSRREFHIDPYGKMTFCCFIKDPELRYDLKKGSFADCWDNFIPSLATKVKVSKEYKENCGSCSLRSHCRWCPVYGYLEHRSLTARVDYLCEVARENKKFKENWAREHRRYYSIGGITLRVESDLPILDTTFHPKFKNFEVDNPDLVNISIRHHFSLPEFNDKDLGVEMYRKPPWAIYRKKDSWIYLGISPSENDSALHRVVVFNRDHTKARIYNDREDSFLKGGLASLTLFPTDQILLAKVLADMGGFYLHSCGVSLEGQGLLFAGHSEAGKSTMATMLRERAKILCDDRIIVRSLKEGFRIYGTWSHGDVPDVSADSAPLKAILFIEKAKENKLIRLNSKEALRRILSCLIKPFVTVDWWEKTFLVVDKIASEVPCYVLRFTKDKKVLDLLNDVGTQT